MTASSVARIDTLINIAHQLPPYSLYGWWEGGHGVAVFFTWDWEPRTTWDCKLQVIASCYEAAATCNLWRVVNWDCKPDIATWELEELDGLFTWRFELLRATVYVELGILPLLSSQRRYKLWAGRTFGELEEAGTWIALQRRRCQVEACNLSAERTSLPYIFL